MMNQRRLLDLCCGAGLASWGYWASGCFSEIVGVDYEQQPHYSFDFINHDALSLTYEFLFQFDFIHASPNCQGYSKLTPDQSKHDRSIPQFRQMLYASGVPHVVENVEGSGKDLRPNLVLSGHDVGLPSLRKRYFHLSTLEAAESLMRTRMRTNMSNRQTIQINSGLPVKREQVIEAMGLHMISSSRLAQISISEIEQGIPPPMTYAIARAHFEPLKVG